MRSHLVVAILLVFGTACTDMTERVSPPPPGPVTPPLRVRLHFWTSVPQGSTTPGHGKWLMS